MGGGGGGGQNVKMQNLDIFLIGNKASIFVCCRIWSDSNTVLFHYGTIILWSCHNKSRLYCYQAENGKIVPIVSITTLPVPRTLAELGFLSRIYNC